MLDRLIDEMDEDLVRMRQATAKVMASERQMNAKYAQAQVRVYCDGCPVGLVLLMPVGGAASVSAGVCFVSAASLLLSHPPTHPPTHPTHADHR